MGYTTNKQYQKSVLNAYTNTSQTLVANQAIAFNNINVLNGCSIDFTAGTTSVELQKPGVYLVTVDSSVAESGTAGVITMQLQNNGVNVNGAVSNIDSTAAGDINGMSFSTVIKVLPSCCAVNNTVTLTVLNTGVGAVYSNANITIIKLC